MTSCFPLSGMSLRLTVFGLIMEHVHDKPWVLGRELRPQGGPVFAPTMAEGKDLVV